MGGKHLTKELKGLIATESASGLTNAEIAEAHGIAYPRVVSLMRSDEMVRLKAEHERYIRDVWARAYMRIAAQGEMLAQGMLEDAFDPNSAKQFEARKYCLEVLRPQRVVGTGDISLNVTSEALRELAGVLSAVRRVERVGEEEGGDSPHLIEGRLAVPAVPQAGQGDGGAPPSLPPVDEGRGVHTLREWEAKGGQRSGTAGSGADQ